MSSIVSYIIIYQRFRESIETAITITRKLMESKLSEFKITWYCPNEKIKIGWYTKPTFVVADDFRS